MGKGGGQSRALAASERSSCVEGVATQFGGLLPSSCLVGCGQQGMLGPAELLPGQCAVHGVSVFPIQTRWSGQPPWVHVLAFVIVSSSPRSFMGAGIASRVPAQCEDLSPSP